MRDEDNLLFLGSSNQDRVRNIISSDSAKANEILRRNNAGTLPFEELILAFVLGFGSSVHNNRKAMREAIEQKLISVDGTRSTSAFESGFELRPEFVAEHAPNCSDLILVAAPNDTQRVEILIHESQNNLFDDTLPAPLKSFFDKRIRPALNLLSTRDPEVHVSPFAVEVFNRDAGCSWKTISLRGLSKEIYKCESVDHHGDIVIVQDFFDGGNFSHFLFDEVTRTTHFLENRPKIGGNATFIFGGRPGPFHKDIVANICHLYDLDQRQIVFPRDAMNLRVSGQVYWFSDQVARPMRPGQLMHATSVELLRKVSSPFRLSRDAGFDTRVYISRADAQTRRLANEAELTPLLYSRGFKVAVLGELPLAAQRELVCSAECVVAPHGMGLTHLASHPEAPCLIELFSPTLGGGDYAMLARAYGCPYSCVVGKEVDSTTHDFIIDVNEVLSVLDEMGFT